ncbi:MAG: cold shock domain-containing protein [Gammaproteobacteria bacterium]|nr:cold shock domain-containing protein [Gammaproteobacteria bacterium]
MRGQVKSYSQRQSYGFIRGDDGKQAFFHKTNLDPGLDDKNIEKDLAVTYEIREGDRGPVATKIQIAK